MEKMLIIHGGSVGGGFDREINEVEPMPPSGEIVFPRKVEEDKPNGGVEPLLIPIEDWKPTKTT